MAGPVSRLIRDGARGLGVDLDGTSAARLAAYVELVLKWTRRVDLTALRTSEAAANRLVLDSLAAAPLLPRDASLVDVGSGAGVPGIPLKLARQDVRVTLVEPRQRRAAFLRAAAAEIPVDVEVVEARHEDLACSFDVAVSRALMPPEKWVEVARTLLRPGGQVLLWSSRPTALKPGRRVAYRLPDGHEGVVELFHGKR